MTSRWAPTARTILLPPTKKDSGHARYFLSHDMVHSKDFETYAYSEQEERKTAYRQRTTTVHVTDQSDHTTRYIIFSANSCATTKNKTVRDINSSSTCLPPTTMLPTGRGEWHTSSGACNVEPTINRVLAVLLLLRLSMLGATCHVFGVWWERTRDRCHCITTSILNAE